MENCCSICGDELKNSYSQKLDCGHEFHYECLMKSFAVMKNNDCPYCRSKDNYLPIVNGLKKIDSRIHNITNNNIPYENIKCKTIMKSGKRKGEECGCYCKLGYFSCSRHLKI